MAVRIGKNHTANGVHKGGQNGSGVHARRRPRKPDKIGANAPKPVEINGNRQTLANVKRVLKAGGLSNSDLKLLDDPAELKNIKEILAIKQQQVDLAERHGQLLPVGEVVKRWTKAMQILRERADGVPSQFKKRFPNAPAETLSWLRAYFGETADMIKRRGI